MCEAWVAIIQSKSGSFSMASWPPLFHILVLLTYLMQRLHFWTEVI